MSLVQLDIFTDQDLEILMLYYSQCALCTMHSVFEIVELSRKKNNLYQEDAML